MTEMVLDASAILAVLRGEPGRDAVIDVTYRALTCSVNLAEVVAKLVDEGAVMPQIEEAVSRVAGRVVDFDRDLAIQAGILRSATRHKGLSLGDRACLALALRERRPVMTADQAWADLDLGIEVVLIR